MKEIIYIAGPVSGIADLNRPAFEKATRKLRGMGYIVRNPHEICVDVDPDDWEACMRKCLREMMDCSLVLLLPGWQQSKGCNLEISNAGMVGIKVRDIESFLLEH